MEELQQGEWFDLPQCTLRRGKTPFRKAVRGKRQLFPRPTDMAMQLTGNSTAVEPGLALLFLGLPPN